MSASLLGEMEDPKKLIRQVGRRIAELRHQAGKTQEEMAEELGVGWRYLSKAERGLENLTLETLAKIAGALGVRARELLDEPAPDARVVRRGRPIKIR